MESKILSENNNEINSNISNGLNSNQIVSKNILK